ncbi:MAG: PucR family transcriptional regulator [Johnsonella sp.]|nr:PucR family transcriptional regulator [Johnsonella sp.]
MNIRDILGFPSLENAKILACEHCLDREITGINILEHTDVELWAREGLIILSSLFAIRELSYDEIKTFFKKLDQLKIPALIIKTKRLVNTVSDDIINLCRKYEIVLIEIDINTKYEEIILDILSPMIHENSMSLKKYYTMHNYFTQLSLQLIPLEEILIKISNVLLNDLTLISENRNVFSTDKNLEDFEILSDIGFTLDFPTNYNISRFEIFHKKIKRKSSVIIVKIPFIKDRFFKLIIYENKSMLTKENLIIVENAINILQVELLKNYYLKLGQFLNNNNLVNDIFYNKINDPYSLNLAIEQLGINKYSHYRVLKLKFFCKEESNDPDFFALTAKAVRKSIKTLNIPFAFYENTDRVNILFNLNEGVDFPVKKVDHMIKKSILSEKHPKIYYHWSLSCEVGLQQINYAYNQATNMHKFFKTGGSDYLIYDQIGTLKLFLNLENHQTLFDYIPKKYFDFYQNNRELFKTLVVFLNAEQNYKLTSELLYLHPKSVKYRIAKIKKILNFDFNDSEEILEFQISSRIFEITEKIGVSQKISQSRFPTFLH